MKPSDGLKITVLSVLILVIFSLPTLTATQLVGVLGTSSTHTSLIFRPVSDLSTFTTFSSGQFSISFQSPRVHNFAIVTNPTDTAKSFTVQILNRRVIPLGAKLTFGEKLIPHLLSAPPLAPESTSIYSGTENPSQSNNTQNAVRSSSNSQKGLDSNVPEGYNSSADLTIGPHSSAFLSLDTTHSDPDHGTIILSVSED